MSSVDQALQDLRTFFDRTIKEYGAVPKGVDWKSEESQFMRFAQLLKIHPDKSQPFSIIDYGCGYGALVKFLQQEGYNFTYIGYDMTPAVIDAARIAFPFDNCTWTSDASTLTPADYCVESGLFNLKFKDTVTDEWYQYMIDVMRTMWDLSLKGASFNALTSYSDVEHMRDDLYYADPCQIFDFCKRNLSQNVALLHDYGFYDFTVLVRR